MPGLFNRKSTFIARRSAGSSSVSSRGISTVTKTFQISDELQPKGILRKFLYSDRSQEVSSVLQLLKNDIKDNPESLFIWTTPTTRLNSQHGELVYPGHTFSSVTNNASEVTCTLSKRPDTTVVLGERRRIADPRFKQQALTTKLFQPFFSSIEEEIEIWVKRASLIPDYPLYVHIIPLIELQLDISTYENNVSYIVEKKEPYTLYSTVHPFADYYIPASNCNSDTELAIFGAIPPSVHDMTCQEAAMTIVSRLIKAKMDYINKAQYLGLTAGIESPSIPKEFYQPGFTC